MNALKKLVPVLLAAMVLSACSPAAKAAELYNEGQALYVSANKAYSDFVLCQTVENQNIEQTFTLYYGYLWAEVQKTATYRESMNAPRAAAAAAPKTTSDQGEEVIDFNKLPEQATPDSIYSLGLSFSVYAVQEAQVLNVPPEVFEKALDAIQVANNHKFQCGITWNNAAAAYNTWRRQVAGRVVGDLAEYFNIEDMPKELPMFSVSQFQPGEAPDTTNPYVPTVAPAP